ncbi:uncharacterized protein [Prorops nasuta]|uniref:uncharacterized protein isoform X2 n=1 Tax=Prorops nasuta TaxID=863751 RepID=UPI0034CDC962
MSQLSFFSRFSAMKHSVLGASVAFAIIVLAVPITLTFGLQRQPVEPRPRVASSRTQRNTAQSSPSTADLMAQNILEWIQGIYTRQGTARKIRQQADSKAYLPPYSTQRPPEKPRPFGPPGGSSGSNPNYASPNQNEVTNNGYPFEKPSTLYTPPNVGYPSGVQQPSSTYLPPSSYNPPVPTPPSPPPAASYPDGASFPPVGYPSPSNGYPAPSGFTNGYPAVRPTPGFPTPPAGGNGYDENATGNQPNGGYEPSPDTSPPFTLPAGPATSGTPAPPSSPPGDDSNETSASDTTGSVSTGAETTIGGGAEVAPGPQEPPKSPETPGSPDGSDDDLKHPPHIHSIDVECSKTMMTINIEFNRAFDGVIYSKGYFMNPDCRYVEQNSGKTQYSFTVSLDSCGTQFINDFEGEAGQAYLENVLVLQNEPGIQEVWDTVRRVRCLWEGNINKALSVSLSVDMLNQEIVTFSGDTATAKLDIQIGKGPFAPAADGLVKIGETMTLVVSVEGDPGFDLQVRDCVARDDSSTNLVQLTDERGCILKPKLFGAFQKTNETGNSGASIIAYAFFQAFKFPDVMDLFIECNVELCKTDCEPCPEANQQIEPGRRRRSVSYSYNSTIKPMLSDPIRVRRGFKVIMLDDLSASSSQLLENMEETAIQEVTKTANVCMSNSGFYIAFSFILSVLVLTTVSTAGLYLKLQRIYRMKGENS